MPKIVNIFLFLLFLTSAQLAQAAQQTILTPDWKSQKLSKTFWGMVLVDLDNDQVQEIVLLERNAIHIAKLEKEKIKIIHSKKWKNNLNATRVFAMDLDREPGQEIVVSAIQQGIPSSFILKFKNKKLEYLKKNIKWHLRVINKYEEEGRHAVLLGQSLTKINFFEGKVYEFAYEEGKLKRGEKVKLPWKVNIFNFAFMPKNDLAVLKGYRPLTVFELGKKRYKKIWTSGQRLGGTLNVIKAKEREPLGVEGDGQVSITKEPEVYVQEGQLFILATKHGLPLKNMIGRYPYVRNGQIFGFKKDESLGFMRAFATQEMPGFIADFVLQQVSEDKKRLFLLVQPDTSAFYQFRESVILAYDL